MCGVEMKRLGTKLVALLILAVMLASCGGLNNVVTTPASPAAQNGTLAQLQSLPVPNGADPAVFQMLKDELARQLSQNGWKSASTPPDPAKPGNAMNDLTLALSGSDWQLTWSYRSIGDYDQDGNVGVSDVTPLAMHYNHVVTDATDPLDPIIDGDGNGVIGVSDITPLAQNFGCRVAGYAVEEMPNGSADWSALDQVLVDTGTGTGRKQFAYTLTAPADLSSFRVRPYDNATPAAFGVESNAVRFAAFNLTVELEVATTPPVSGIGTEADPYVVEFNTITPIEYDIRVYYAKGEAGETDVTDQVSFDTFPPAFISFDPAVLPEAAKMTVDNPMAGSFNITASWGDVAPLTTDPLYFRVQGGLPG
jgi:hypothetical protein